MSTTKLKNTPGKKWGGAILGANKIIANFKRVYFFLPKVSVEYQSDTGKKNEQCFLMQIKINGCKLAN